MDCVLLLDEEGRLFQIEPPCQQLTPLQDRRSLIGERRFNRVSNSGWCFWAVTADFELELYVYESQVSTHVIECVYENQRRCNGEYSGENLRPSDPAKFCSLHNGSVYLLKEAILLPTDNWRWTSDWFVQDFSKANQGWHYAVDFDKEFKPKHSWYTNVRRRKWLRKRTFISHETLIQVDLPLECEFVNDISIGGWSLPDSPKGFLCVWIVSNCGRIFFRHNVSYVNPEGTHWSEIPLPDEYRATSICCQEKGLLWVVTSDGGVLLRNEVSVWQPCGKCWLEINPCGIFNSITANATYVFCLDSRGNVYMRTDLDELEQGKHWILVLTGLSGISVSTSNKLWAISCDKKVLNIGSKLQDMSLKGFSWKTVFLPAKFDQIDAKTACDYIDDLAELKFYL